MSDLKQALGLNEDESPFPWQEELLAKFRIGIGNRMSLDIPTGLGKTSVMAAWLVARSQDAPVPRRLVYVVDRRAVVDQATREAEKLRDWVDDNPDVKSPLGLDSGRSLVISTGLLGCDTLFVLDEAHLLPPFEMMLEGCWKHSLPKTTFRGDDNDVFT